ncbi:hypothetical protein OEZ85_010568 [Tetradesmus obliquus]|uniref:Hydantoinase A/oxoprolinase domain-containing protein n=1 Tax=Tetradesmus obliquus TaxID=3088 RepID=A0ABY8TMP7_TETOB|nr:hypothetical protein OEZ85_010568 [Tetradesmus obliquus]
MLGTTQFVNAVIEQKHLSKVFVVRLCGTATRALPPFSGMPSSLTQQISAGYLLASGGFEYDGTTEISLLQASTDAATAADAMLAAGAAAAAVCGVHTPLNPCQELAFGQELQAALQQRAPGLPVHITLSHKLSGRLGLLEREAAAAINASLAPLAAAVVPQYAAALQQLGLQVPLYITGNDGTLLSAAVAQEHPVLTFKSGPVNSVRGAAFLAGVGDALVCDIGGTTTDIEVGGGNALEPLAVGMELGLPVVDADLMGRAFPELQMSTAAIAGVPLTPAAVADDKGNVLLMAAAASPNWAERVLRAACTEMGCSVGLASSPMTGTTAHEVVVPGSLSLAWHIGMAVLTARAANADPVAAVLQLYGGSGRLLLRGKVVGPAAFGYDAEYQPVGPFPAGLCTVHGLYGVRA